MNRTDANEEALTGTELEKTYNPAEKEERYYEEWQRLGVFNATADTDKEAYAVLMPPPNVTGILTMGHVLNNTIQDIYVRWNRMRGRETCWFPGIDHAGIATQSKVERKLAAENISRYDLGREKFLEKVWEWKQEYGNIILKQLRKLGVSCDWDRTLFTMDESASNAVREVFIRLFDEGLIYRGKRIINWSPLAQSALSDEEVQFREVHESIYTLRYVPENGGQPLLVATVRPETLFGDVAVAVNPRDERYKDMIGTNVRVPLVGRLVPVIADEYADPAFGTGVVKITPAHDPNDFEVGLRHKLDMPNTINPDGTLNELTGEFKGVERFAARKQILARLHELDLVEKTEDYTHNVGFSERGGEAVEPYLSNQWFVKMEPLAGQALQVVRDGRIRFFPEHWTKTYEHWLGNIRDWCISRQLWWGHRIPVYYAENGAYTAARSEEEARGKLGLAADAPLRQDPDVLDTWFSSWLWPLTTMNWLADGTTEDTPELRKFLPTDLLVTGPDIIFFWVARMIMLTLKFKGAIPFRDVYFTSMIRDDKGRKMSKSLGNSPDPLAIIEKYGADAMRFTVIHIAPIGQDIRIAVDPKSQDVPIMEFGRNFANKLWNAARFLLMKKAEVFSAGEEPSASLDRGEFALSDAWISARFHQSLRESQQALEEYKLHEYAKKLYEFIWGDFCAWYVEILKIRIQHSADAAYNQRLMAHALSLFEGLMRLLHPAMPFVTEELWQAVARPAPDTCVATQPVPVLDESLLNEQAVADFGIVQNIVDEIRTMRGQMKIPPHEKLPVTISAADTARAELLDSQAAIIGALAKVSELHIGTDLRKPEGAIGSVVQGSEVFLSLKGVVDFAEERKRLEKEIARISGMIRGSEAKLNNEKFVSNAPDHVVAYEREKLENQKTSVAKLQANLAQLSE